MPTDPELEAFLKKQEEIYTNSFKAKTGDVLDKGIIPDPALVNSHAGFGVYYKHGDLAARSMAFMASEIAKIVPCVAYTPDMLHTTITAFGVEPGRQINPESEEDKKTLEALKDAVNYPPAWLDHAPSPEFVFDSYLINQTTVIARGKPTLPFLMEAKLITHRLKERGIEARMPWGAHVTIARFTEKVENHETMTRLIKLVREGPLWLTSRNNHYGCGYFHCTPNSFTLSEYK